MKEFDTLIIGGGAAGIMASLSVRKHHPMDTICILDQSFELGRKILVSGAGRGNLTNSNLQKNPEVWFSGDKQLVKNVFMQFGYEDIVSFFERNGIPLYEEKKTGRGKIFPVIDHSRTVRDILLDLLIEGHIEAAVKTRVMNIEFMKDRWHVSTDQGEYSARSCIVTAGGMTYPSLGSDGTMYGILEQLGHTIVQPVVSAVPLVSSNQLSHFLQGEKSEMQITVFDDGEKQIDAIGEVMFTNYGFSGPAALDVSRYISIQIHRGYKRSVDMKLSFFPSKSMNEAKSILKERMQKHPELPVDHCLFGLFTEKVASALCAVSKLPKGLKAAEMTDENFNGLLNSAAAFAVTITDTRGWNEGEFTAGGVDGKEIIPDTLESQKHKRLYFAGEIIDVDGPVGGYNLSWAWASGYVAGKLK